MKHQRPHKHSLTMTACCTWCGGPALTPVGDEATCAWCNAPFKATLLQPWCDRCSSWLAPQRVRRTEPTQIDPARTAKCAHPGCNERINHGPAFLCGDPCDNKLLWGCGQFYCRTHVDAGHDCPGYADLSMHVHDEIAGEAVCEWDHEPYPCSAVRADPDNPTIADQFWSAA